MHSGHTGTLHLRQQQLSYISLPTARAMYVSTYLAEVQLLSFFFCFFFFFFFLLRRRLTALHQ